VAGWHALSFRRRACLRTFTPFASSGTCYPFAELISLRRLDLRLLPLCLLTALFRVIQLMTISPTTRRAGCVRHGRFPSKEPMMGNVRLVRWFRGLLLGKGLRRKRSAHLKHGCNLRVETLERRQLLSAISSTSAGGAWNSSSTWVGGQVPGSADIAIIATLEDRRKRNAVPGLRFRRSA
jgi:hypothetical protein